MLQLKFVYEKKRGKTRFETRDCRTDLNCTITFLRTKRSSSSQEKKKITKKCSARENLNKC